MAEFIRVAKLGELKEGKVKGVKVGSEEIAIYRLGNEVFATTDICTHEECVISENFYIEANEVECTCHGSRFDIKTGENTAPPAAEPLRTYEVRVEDDRVMVKV